LWLQQGGKNKMSNFNLTIKLPNSGKQLANTEMQNIEGGGIGIGVAVAVACVFAVEIFTPLSPLRFIGRQISGLLHGQRCPEPPTPARIAPKDDALLRQIRTLRN